MHCAGIAKTYFTDSRIVIELSETRSDNSETIAKSYTALLL